jgi:hypothetical protein
MPISQSKQIFNLIKSLTKAEKRNFKVYAKRLNSSDDQMFLRLFDVMDKQKELDDATVIKGLQNISKTQYTNLKRHLYAQVLASLRMLHKEKRVNFKVREFIDYAYILYGKGLYLPALKILSKARKLAQKHHLVYMQLTIVEFEKTIESRHITRSGSSKAQVLIDESESIQKDADYLIRLSNLRLKVHALYLQRGSVQSAEEAQAVRDFFHKQIKNIDLDSLGLIAKINYIQSRVWYNYILLDYKSCMKWAKQWVALLDSNPILFERDMDIYMRGFHYILTSATHIKDRATHKKYLAKFEKFRKDKYGLFNHNSQIISFLYVHTGRLDHIIIEGDFEQAESVIANCLRRIKKYQYKMDGHRILVFYFKFAWIYLALGNISKAITYLNHITNNRFENLREDLQNYARLLLLMCHYELKNFDIFDYLINTYTTYFKKKDDLNILIQHSVEMFNQLQSAGLLDHKSIFKKYLKIYKAINKDPYERRALVYLDMISWITSKVKSVPLKEVIRKG